MLYVLCVEVLACKIRASQIIEGFLPPGAGGLQFKVCQYADDMTAFVKSVKSFHALFSVISDFERGSAAKLNRSKTEALWLGSWKDRTDEPMGLAWVRKTKILGIVFGTINVERDNWEPRLSTLGKCVSSWKNRSLSMIGKVLVLNILGFSKLLFVSSTLAPPKWAYDRINRIIWPFFWGSRIETMAWRSFVCSPSEGGLGLREFRSQGQASRLSILCRNVANVNLKCFYLIKYFCGAQPAGLLYATMPRLMPFRHRHFTFPFYRGYGTCIFLLIFLFLLRNAIPFFWLKYRQPPFCPIFETLSSPELFH